ncbi:hypothetical protein N752_28615 [Desulforamulus aquiferis]|nr:hypothetical protein [Desulforamulus aquiferis]RYD01818.1 hypothetical protein N752_28615 [Desulforamulus aquiferis]
MYFCSKSNNKDPGRATGYLGSALSLSLIFIVSKFTPDSIPTDARQKMLVLHAPEELALRSEYIKEQGAAPGAH